jgi:phage repressor protein C with HTH and peptisase S24 domain
MVDFESVIDRLKQYFIVSKDTELADELGISQGNFGGYKKRGTIPYEQILKTLDNTDADLQWIFYGIETKKSDIPKTAFIQYYSDLSSSDGNGTIDLLGPYEIIQIDATLFPDTDIKNIIAIKVHSTIMSPTIMSQDTVFVDRSKTPLVSGKAYLIQINGIVLLTRMYVTSSGWMSKPDNGNYPEDFITEDKIRVIGKMTHKMGDIG